MLDAQLLAAWGGAKICAALALATLPTVRWLRSGEVEWWAPGAVALLLACVAHGLSDLTIALSGVRRRHGLLRGAGALSAPDLSADRLLGPSWGTPTGAVLGLGVIVAFGVGKLSAAAAVGGVLPVLVVVGVSTVRLVDEALADLRWRRVRLCCTDGQARTGPIAEPRRAWSGPSPDVVDAALSGLRRNDEAWVYVQLVLVREERPSPPFGASWFRDADLATSPVIATPTEGARRLRIRAAIEPFGPFEPPPAAGAHGRAVLVVGGRERRVRVVLRARLDRDVVEFEWPPTTREAGPDAVQ